MSTEVDRAAARKQPPRLVTKFGPVAMLLAGRRWFPPWAQLRHRGRRSGKEYAIPVALLVTPTTFVIGLPWGAANELGAERAGSAGLLDSMEGCRVQRDVAEAGRRQRRRQGCQQAAAGHDQAHARARLPRSDALTNGAANPAAGTR